MFFSVITACFNSEETIGDCIASLDDQSFQDFEHIIVDGGSSDGTVELVAGASSNARSHTSEPDEGVYDAMNKGIGRATGDVIGFLNADDFYEDRNILAAVSKAFSDPEVDLVYGKLRYVDFEDTSKVVRDWKSEPFEKGMFLRGWMPPHPTVYARRELFEKFGGFDDAFEICADWEWLYRMFEVHKVRSRFLDEYFVRMRMGGVSNRSLGNIWRSNRQAADAFRKHGKRVPISFYPGKILHRLKQFG